MGEKPYNNVLLYGDRGTGKSSCVKALANEFENVRIIRVEKDKLQYLGEIAEKIEQSPFKFIIFLDDMTTEELSEKLGVPVEPLDSDGSACVRTLLGL